MRLIRFGASGCERPGLVDAEDRVRDLSTHISDIAGEVLMPAGLQRVRDIADQGKLPLVAEPGRCGPPLAGIGKIIGVGLNYKDHAEETGSAPPTEPTLFLKATSSLTGSTDDILIPREGKSVDWEVELGVVIGAPGVYIDEATALDHVAGYLVGIDVSERDFQFHRGGQGFKGKSCDTFAPLGPWLVTADDVPDPHALRLQLSVNHAVCQEGNTADMIFPVQTLVAYVSQFMSLQSGDVILTGTPAGVGLGEKPPRYLKAGDVVSATIDGLGTQTHLVRNI